jgi:hypothetical protein
MSLPAEQQPDPFLCTGEAPSLPRVFLETAMISTGSRLLDRELITVIERLADEFRETPIGTIARTVQAAAPRAHLCDVRVMSTVVTCVEATVRQSLLPTSWHAA